MPYWLVIVICVVALVVCSTLCCRLAQMLAKKRQAEEEEEACVLPVKKENPLATLPVIGMGPDGHWFPRPQNQPEYKAQGQLMQESKV